MTLAPRQREPADHARSVLYGLERMQGELSEYSDGVRGHVRHARHHFLYRAVSAGRPGRLPREHSQIKIDLQEHLSADVLQAVHEGTADIGICNMGQANPNGLQTRPYRTDHLVLVAPEDHPLTERSAIAFEEVLDWDVVGLHGGSSISLAMRGAATRSGTALRQRIQVTSLDAMCRMIDNGLGVGLIPTAPLSSCTAWAACAACR